MKARDKMLLKGLLTLSLYALLVTQGLAGILTVLANSLNPEISPTWSIAFGWVTMPAVVLWVRNDAEQAYVTAVNRNCVIFDDSSTGGVSIAERCPKRWLVRLHVQLHPELLSAK